MQKMIVISIMFLALAGCADKVYLSPPTFIDYPGFWQGIWHGFICPFAFAISLFDHSVGIYATYNNGGWYDFGFIVGVDICIKLSTYAASTEKK